MALKVAGYPARLASPLIIILILAAAPAFSAPVGHLANISGGVYFRAGGTLKWAPARRRADVNAGDHLKTGGDGRALIELSDGSQLSMGNESEIEITEFLVKGGKRRGVFYLSTGKIRALVKSFSGTTDIKVRTPTSVSGVKGTEFIVLNKGSANAVFGVRESVTVSGDGGGGVVVAGGEMTENTEGSPPIEPVAVEPGSALDEVRSALAAVTDIEAPVEWEKAGRLPDILARWNINYGHYLADSRRFSEALAVFRIAVDLTEAPGIKAEAHLERGTVLSRNLDEPLPALDEYMSVIESYPVEPFVENAFFSAGLINMELGEKKRALDLFTRYMDEYPEGAHRDTVEVFIRTLEKD